MVCTYDTLGEIVLMETNNLGSVVGTLGQLGNSSGQAGTFKKAKAILIVETLKVSLGATRKHDPERLASVAKKWTLPIAQLFNLCDAALAHKLVIV